MMHELFLFGTFWFWILTAAAIVVVFLFSENEMGFGGSISLLVYAGVLQFCSDVNVLGYLHSHPFLSLGWLAGYFVIGLFWASFKWVLFAQDKFSEIQDHYRDWLEIEKLSVKLPFAELTAEQKAQFDVYLANKSPYPTKLTRRGPRFRDHLDKFSRWIGFWLFNMIYTLMNDFVRRTARALARSVAQRMQAISDRIWAPFQD